jgi:hypothetical protein
MRWVSSDGRWRVDLIRLTQTGTGRDGEWLRVTDRAARHSGKPST